MEEGNVEWPRAAGIGKRSLAERAVVAHRKYYQPVWVGGIRHDQVWRPVRIGGWMSVEEDIDQQEVAVGRQNRLCRHPLGLCRGVYRLALRAQLQLAVFGDRVGAEVVGARAEEHTSELQSLMRISYAVFCLKKKKQHKN